MVATLCVPPSWFRASRPLIVFSPLARLHVLLPVFPARTREGASRTHVKACLLTVSDRASQGVYEDLSGPAMREFLENKVKSGACQPLSAPLSIPTSATAAAVRPGVVALDPLTWCTVVISTHRFTETRRPRIISVRNCFRRPCCVMPHCSCLFAPPPLAGSAV